MKQKYAFLEGEADAWLKRNADRIGNSDPVSDLIAEKGLHPANVLEIGCANGWRLARLRDKYQCRVAGVDPGREACLKAAAIGVPALQTTASCLPMHPKAFDMVIYGFCLYVTDPGDWFHIVAEGDSVLQDGGHVVIHDFGDVFKSSYARHYEHRAGIMAYHVDFARFWMVHPLYEFVATRWAADEMVTILRKNPKTSIEVRR